MDLVINSGWSKTERSIGGSGGRGVNSGDLEVSGNSITLQCKEIEDISLFDDLVSLADWVGKEIESIRPIEGAGTHFAPGSSNFHDGKDIHTIDFTGGKTSVFLFEGDMAVDTFENREAPDMDLMIQAGIFVPEVKDEREREQKMKNALRERSSHLHNDRKAAQQALLKAGRRDGRSIYKGIEQTEKALEEVQEQLNQEWKWGDYVVNCQTIFNWVVPGMVDLFNWRDRELYSWMKTDRLISPEGQKIVAVHKIFESEGSDRDSQDVYALEFESGAFSLPFGLCHKTWLEIPLKSLDALGLIPEEEMRRVLGAIGKARNNIDIRKNDVKRLSDLREQLEEYGIGEKRTRKIVAEIAVLEAEDENESHQIRPQSPHRGGMVCS